MKKLSLITVLSVSLVLFAGTGLVFAESSKDKNPTAVQNSGKNKNIEVLDVEEVETESPEPEETQEPEDTKGKGNSTQVQLQNAIRKMEKLQEQITDPQIGEEIQETAQNQEQAREQIEKHLEEMNARPGLLKFILGPDYKNAGQVRSAIVRLQNEERQMLRIKEKLDNPEEIGVMEEAMETVQTSIRNYQDLLYDKLSGFSLFGWLSKYLSGYTPEPSPSPTATSSALPTAIPTQTP